MREFILREEIHLVNLIKFLHTLDFKSTPYRITIKIFRKQRTMKQNNLYWDWLTIIGEFCGYDKDEMHDILREKFLPVHYVEIFGVQKKVLTSTSDESFTTADMAEYMAHIDRFAATELGIQLPRPADRGLAELAARFGE